MLSPPRNADRTHPAALRKAFQASQAEEIERTPLRRVAEAVDQANVICFLALAAADFVTGIAETWGLTGPLRSNGYRLTNLLNIYVDKIFGRDTDTERKSGLRIGLLYRHRTGNSLHRAGELDQKSVAHNFEQPPRIFADAWLDDVLSKRLEPRQRSTLVRAD
jgi:hypothetical protein